MFPAGSRFLLFRHSGFVVCCLLIRADATFSAWTEDI